MDDLTFLGHGNVSILGIAESNLNWRQRSTYYDFKKYVRRVWPHVKLSVSSSGEVTPSSYQPGGTTTIATQEWCSRVVSSGHDTLGRWSHITITGKQVTVTFITAYVPDSNMNNAGTDTWRMQLWRLHRANGISKPNPRQLLWKDLETFILECQSRGSLIILMMDANATFDDGDLQMNRLKTICNLHDTHSYRHDDPPLPTYSRGRKKIDHILASSIVLSSGALVGAGTLALTKDHILIIPSCSLIFTNPASSRHSPRKS
jgi:hypothetical protein